MVSGSQQADITRIVVAVLLLGVLIVSSFLVMEPFLPALVWATMIVISSWKLLLRVQALLGGRRGLAVVFMTLTLTLLLVVPLTIAIWTIVDNIGEVGDKARSIITFGIPAPPAWLSDLPLVGSRLATRWEQAALLSNEELAAKFSPYVGTALGWVVKQIGGLGQILLHFILTIVIAALLYARGETAARGMLSFARHLAKERGEKALLLAAQAIRAVSNGVILTALLQSAMAALGLALAGVPYVAVLSSLTFFLCLLQVGPLLVLLGANIWLYHYGSILTFWVFIFWSVFIMIADNFLRPILIKRGANLPLVLIFAGVIGGLIAFGVIGIFVGPVVLAISYTWLQSWIGISETTPAEQLRNTEAC